MVFTQLYYVCTRVPVLLIIGKTISFFIEDTITPVADERDSRSRLRYLEIGTICVLFEFLLLLPAQIQTIAHHHRSSGTTFVATLTLFHLQFP